MALLLRNHWHGQTEIAINLDQAQKGAWQGFPVMHKSADFYSSLAQKNGLEIRDLGALSKWGHLTGDPKQDNQTMLSFTKK